MTSSLFKYVTAMIHWLDFALFGEDTATLYPRVGQSTLEAWANVPVWKRGFEWTADGRLFKYEIKRCPQSGLTVTIKSEVRG